MSSYIHNLTLDVLGRILSKISVWNDVENLACTCKYMYQACVKAGCNLPCYHFEISELNLAASRLAVNASRNVVICINLPNELHCVLYKDILTYFKRIYPMSY